jgi:hypothetical protein
MGMQSFHLLLNNVQGKRSPFFGIFAVFFHALYMRTAFTGRKPTLNKQLLSYFDENGWQ